MSKESKEDANAVAAAAATAAVEAEPAPVVWEDGMPKTVGFEHHFFRKIEDLYFRISEQTGEPVAVVKLGSNEVALTFRGLKREFKIVDDSPDGRMLGVVAQGLEYVKGLRPGDPVPRELVTREASWEPQERHFVIAHQRLTLQLVSWLSGDEHVLTNPEELMQVAEDPLTKKKVSEAFSEAAEKLGIGRENREQVIGYIEGLSRELAYIECLRDQVNRVRSMGDKIQGLRKIYGHERSVLEVADPVARLAQHALRRFEETVAQVDAQTGEIMGLLRNLEAHTTYIRDIRDHLHHHLMAWDEILEVWDAVKVKMSPDKPDLLRDVYRFLAPRYMQVNDWVLMTKLQQSDADGKKKLKSMVW